MRLHHLHRRPALAAAAVSVALAALVLLVSPLLSCGETGGGPTTSPSAPAGGAGGAEGAAQVIMKDLAFDPATATIRAGGSVTWTNEDGVTHTVVADDGAFTSGDIEPGQTYSITIEKAGVYAYHCSIHPTMKGTVTVRQ